MFKSDIGKNDEKTDEIAREISRLIKTIRASTQKNYADSRIMHEVSGSKLEEL